MVLLSAILFRNFGDNQLKKIIMERGIFLTINDLMKLNGSLSYFGCAKSHRLIRLSIAKNKRKLTIKEYCDYEIIDFKYVWKYLREKQQQDFIAKQQ